MAKHTVNFKFTTDDYGHYGLIPEFAYYHDNASKFNSAWNVRLLLHDVFEHFFEGQYFFKGEHALEPEGEIAAMGACWYYYNTLQPGYLVSAIHQGWHSPEKIIGGSIGRAFQDSMLAELLLIPYQGQNEAPDVADEIILLAKSEELAPEYLKSITKGKVNRLLNWGYKQAEKRFAPSNHNSLAYCQIWDFFETFFKNDAESMCFDWNVLTISVITDHREITSWNVKLKDHENHEKWAKRGEKEHFYFTH